MMANLSDPPKTNQKSLKFRHISLNTHKLPKNTHSHHSFIKEHQHKIHQMLQMNKKYQQDLINNQFYKIVQLEKYSPQKIYKNQKEKLHQNLSPIKFRKSSSSKEKNTQKNTIQDLLTKYDTTQSLTLFGKKFAQKKIIQNESSLTQIPQNEIIISRKIQDSYSKNLKYPYTGFWISQNKMVSLFPVTNRKIDKVPVINQPYILPMLGSLTVKNNEKRSQKYIVTELYESNSLKDILNQFQNIDQQTVKNYLRKIILCIWNLHKNRIAHNRLTLQAFITTQNGDLLLNMLKASTKSLNQKQKFEKLHYFPPQMLLSRTNCDSTKNDIWAIGCIALELLTNSQPKVSIYHPYNQFIESEIEIHSPTKLNSGQSSPKDKNTKFLTSFEASRMTSYNLMNDSNSILEKVKRLIEAETFIESPKQGLICIDLCESIVLRQISPLAADFIKKCLNIKLQKRPSVDQLMFHPFLK